MPPKKKRKKRIPVSNDTRKLYLLKKRNVQFSKLIERLRDPKTYTELFSGITALYRKHELSTSPVYIEILIFAAERSFFTFEEFYEAMDYESQWLKITIMKLVNKGFITRTKNLRYHKKFVYYISPEGRLFIKDFIKDGQKVISAILKNKRVVGKMRMESIFK